MEKHGHRRRFRGWLAGGRIEKFACQQEEDNEERKEGRSAGTCPKEGRHMMEVGERCGLGRRQIR